MYKKILISFACFTLLQEAISLPALNISRNSLLGCPHQCSNGECITLDKLCDGMADCADQSDEMLANCDQIFCPGYTFRCDYGACVSRDAVCDGKTDCADGSDEQKWLCVAKIMRGNCKNWEISCASGECMPYAKLCDGKNDCANGDDESFSLCGNDNHTLNNNTTLDATAELEVREVPNTLSYVAYEKSMPAMQVLLPVPIVKCVVPQLQNIIIRNKFNEVLPAGSTAINGSKIYFACQFNHELSGEQRNYCENGKWQQEFPYCQKPLELAFVLIIILISTLCVVMLYMIYRLQRDWRQPKDRVWYVEPQMAQRSMHKVETAAAAPAAASTSSSTTSAAAAISS